jgi:hypothetical protein
MTCEVKDVSEENAFLRFQGLRSSHETKQLKAVLLSLYWCLIWLTLKP